MNTIEVPTQNIELVFMNCDSVYIDIWAIKAMSFTVEKEKYTYDRDRKNFLQLKYLSDFIIELDLYNPSYFYHCNRLKEKTDSTEVDGNKCIERLVCSNDLTHVIINGICYTVPWESFEYDSYSNSLQKNEDKQDRFGERSLIIKVVKNHESN